jgi:branched-chain amino acid transport system permease protein
LALSFANETPMTSKTTLWPLRRGLFWLCVSTSIVALIPLIADPYWTRLLVFMFINIGLASSWNIIGGITGYPSFGHGVFFGVGAYTCAILISRYHMPLAVAIPAAAVVVAIFSLSFMPMFKQRGFFFALSTLAAALAIETVIRNIPWVRGLDGTNQGWNLPNNFSVHFYFYCALAALLACLSSLLILLNSRIGLALRAIHKDEVVASAAGINCAQTKMIAFVVSAIWPAVFGAIYAPFLVYISPETVFDLKITLNMIVFSVFGGIGTFLGPIVGGIGLTLIDQLAWSNFLDYHSLIYGVLMVVIITFSPGGVLSWIHRPAHGGKV